MKKPLIYLIPALLLFVIAGCVKTNNAPTVLPVGIFSGVFTRLHLNTATNKIDTLTANLTVTMSASSGYAVTGDTTHHAGSHGSYVVDGVNILFSDQTLPSNATTVPPAKVHLSGLYQYNYSAPNLQIQFSNDTLVYNYTLKTN